MKEFFLFLAITIIFSIFTFYFPMLKDNIISLAESSDVFNFASFIIGFLTLIMTCITDAGIIKSYNTLDAKKLEYSAMKSKFRLPRNLFVILLLIILLTAIRHLWDFYFISVIIVSLYFLAILLSFKFPYILKKESFVVIRKELIDKQKEEKKKNKDRVRASERLLNLREQKK